MGVPANQRATDSSAGDPKAGDSKAACSKALDTKQRILEAAEALFVERGFSGASLRAVTGAAGVNLAAVHYHFGSKEGLLHALLDQHVGPINQDRLERLLRLEAASAPAAPSAEAVLRAFIEPALMRERGRDPQRVRSLLGRIYGEPPHLVGPLVEREFGALGRRFVEALERSLPQLPRDELRWRFQFVVGALLYVISGNAGLALQFGPELGRASTEELVELLLGFVEAGIGAPARASRAEGTE